MWLHVKEVQDQLSRIKKLKGSTHKDYILLMEDFKVLVKKALEESGYKVK